MDDHNEGQIDLREYLRVVLKRKWTIFTIFFLTTVIVTIHSFTATPVYQAATRIIIEKENPNIVSIQEVMAVNASGSGYYQTQYKIIGSRSVAREAIKRLGLNKGENQTLLSNPSDDYLSVFIRSIKKTLKSWNNSVFGLLKTEKPEDGLTAEEKAEYHLVNRFTRRIAVLPVRNSRLVNLKFSDKNPAFAAKAANAVAQAYIDQNLEIKLGAVQDAVKWLHERIEKERHKVAMAEEALLAYKDQYSIVTDFTGENEAITAQKLAQLNSQVVDAESIRVEAETRYRQALALKGSPDLLDSIPEVLSNALINQIKGMEVDLYKRMSELSKKYGSNHPQMVAINSELKSIQKRKTTEVHRVINSLKNQYEVSLAKEQSLKTALANQKQESLALNKKAIEYSVLRREAESAREMYDLLLKRFKEASLTEDMKTGNIRIIDRAEVPQAPISPNKRKNILLAMVLGLTLGTGLAFLFEFLDNTIKTPEEIKRYLNIPYLGPVPAMDLNGSKGAFASLNTELEAAHSPKSTASESYRGIRTNILLSAADAEPQVLLISSSGPQEGKTMTTANLAVTMCQAGSRVVLLDCDLRRPKLHKLFGVSRDQGMSNLLVGKLEIKDALQQAGLPNLYIIPSGPIPPNPSEILGSKRMKELIAGLRKNFDRILIDTPPISAVTDAAVMTQSIDGMVLVVRSNDKSREHVRNSLDKVTAVGAPILGAVLNGVDTGKNSYYYYQYSYYYYGEDDQKKKKTRKRRRSKDAYVEHSEA